MTPSHIIPSAVCGFQATCSGPSRGLSGASKTAALARLVAVAHLFFASSGGALYRLKVDHGRNRSGTVCRNAVHTPRNPEPDMYRLAKVRTGYFFRGARSVRISFGR
jgi:hypothetical protein